MRDYIDSHVHVWTADTGRYPMAKGVDAAAAVPRDFPPETLLRWARPSRVGRIVLVGTSKYGTDNRYLFDTIERFPAVFRCAPIVDHLVRAKHPATAGYSPGGQPDASPPRARMREMLGAGATAFRIVPQGSYTRGWDEPGGYDALFAAAAETGQAVCALISPAGLADLDAACARHPKTTVVVDHMARIGADSPISDADVSALCGLARHPKTYVKLSAFYALGEKKKPHDDLKPVIKKLVEAFGVERLMWGSDAPHQVVNETYDDSISLVRDRLEFLSEAQRRRVLRDTAEEVFFWR